MSKDGTAGSHHAFTSRQQYLLFSFTKLNCRQPSRCLLATATPHPPSKPLSISGGKQILIKGAGYRDVPTEYGIVPLSGITDDDGAWMQGGEDLMATIPGDADFFLPDGREHLTCATPSIGVRMERYAPVHTAFIQAFPAGNNPRGCTPLRTRCP